MRRKCGWCKKVKAVICRDIVSGDFFCSMDCMRKKNHMLFISKIECARCGNQIRMNAVVQRRYTNSDIFYCSEKCAMDDLGIVQDVEEKEPTP